MDDCGRIMLSAQKARVDRFVVPRESLPEISRRVKWRSRHSQEDEAEIWSNKYFNQKKYSDFLDKAFNLTPLKIYREPVDPRPHSDWCWPCEPRRKRFLSTADNILDLPAYSSAAFPDLLDWSKEDILVAALGRYYYKWSWKLQRAVSQGFTMYDIQCCKFDPTGKYLLLATHFRVEVHNEACKCRLVQYCKCNLRLCTVTTVDWSPTGRSYVMGCSRGMICAGDRQERIISSVSLFDNATLTAKISPNARFVAVTAVRHSTVWVLAWPQLDRFRYLNTNYIIKDLCWHPWETALLGVATIGRDYQARVVLWEPNGVRYREERVGRGQFSIDVMKFNHRTGELLLSLWSLGVPYNKSSELVVMSDFGTVVDHWGEGQTGLNRVRTMVFSADGTKLATATADEDLIICNFLPNDFKRNKIPRKFMAMPQLLDLFSCGFTIR